MIELIKGIVAHSNELWVQILLIIGAVGSLVKGIETILQLIAPMTPWKWDDNLATALGKILAAKIFQKKI